MEGRNLLILLVFITLSQCTEIADDPYVFSSTYCSVSIINFIDYADEQSALANIAISGGIGQDLNYCGICWLEGDQNFTLESSGVQSVEKPIRVTGTDVNGDGIADFTANYNLEYSKAIQILVNLSIETIYSLRPYIRINEYQLIYGPIVTYSLQQ